MKRPEILAPAGSMESLTAAVNCGADAVYLGAKALNARRNAANFDEGELAEAVRYAHIHGAKIFQTLNIIMFDGEEKPLIEAAEAIARLGVDAAIVQDWGVLSILRRSVPGLPLYASTQMAVHNLSGVRMAERLGCRRVVLARELTAAEIGHIVKNAEAEIEVFVHGALCMSVSGQCYLSSMLGGRSGNRGLCAQPCRLPFGCGGESHALSLKDLSLAERSAELAALGVTSLKIEGQMKRPEYVAAAVTAVRMALDGQAPDIETLRSVFSRSGFTTGYFDGQRDKKLFGFRQKEDVTAAAPVLGRLSKLAADDIGPVAIKGAFTAIAGEPVSLSIADSDKNLIYIEGEIPQLAQTKPTDEARIRQSLSKTGGTAFRFEELDIQLDEGLMLPVSQLNALRRSALEHLAEKRGKPRQKEFLSPSLAPIIKPAGLKPKPVLRARCRLEQLSAKLDESCGQLLLPLSELAPAIEAGISPDKLTAEIPRMIFECEEQALSALRKARALGVKSAWCGNIGAFYLAGQADMEICGGWSLNISNRHSIEQLEALGMKQCELSFELELDAAKSLCAAGKTGIIAYGSLPLMTFRACPVRARLGCKCCGGESALTDRKGVSFPVRCPGHKRFSGESELFNSVPLYLADRLKELSGFDFLTLWFTGEDKARCADTAAQYRTGGSPPQAFTRGLYYRQVL